MAPVDQYRKLDAARAAAGEYRLDGGTHGASGVDHIVCQHHVASRHIKRQGRAAHSGQVVFQTQIVAVETDVDTADGDVGLFDAADVITDAFGNRAAAAADAHQHYVLRALVLFHDLMGDTHQGAVQRRLVHELGFLSHLRHLLKGHKKSLPFPTRRTPGIRNPALC